MSDGFALALQKALRTSLLADGGVVALVSTRVYDEPPQNVVYPYIRFGSIVPDTYDTDGSTSANVAFTLECYSRATGRVQASQIAEAVRVALHRNEAAVVPTGFGVVEMICEQYFVDRDDSVGRGYTARVLFSAIMETA